MARASLRATTNHEGENWSWRTEATALGDTEMFVIVKSFLTSNGNVLQVLKIPSYPKSPAQSNILTLDCTCK